MLEVCIDSLESAINAIHGGTDELEICSSLPEGGLTPTSGLVTEVLKVVNKIGSGKPVYKTCLDECTCLTLIKKPKVNVMLRCRTGSDFCYNEQEMDTMLADIDIFQEMGVNRFVFGALTSSQTLDEENCSKVVKRCHPIPVTFHRAIDVCKDPIDSLEKIIRIGFNRLLTSGQKSSASDVEGMILIKKLQITYGDNIEIMPGAGVNVANAKSFVDFGCKIVHSSCKSLRVLSKVENNLSMGTSDRETIYITDEEIVRKMKESLST